VGTLKPHVEGLSKAVHPDRVTVLYGEVYGHSIGAGAKNYAASE